MTTAALSLRQILARVTRADIPDAVAEKGQRWHNLSIVRLNAQWTGVTTDWLESLHIECERHIIAILAQTLLMPHRPNPLNNYPVMDSSDPEQVRDRLFTFYGARHFDIASQKNEFAVRANHLQIGGLGLSYCDYANDVSVGFGEETFVRQIFNLQGEGEYTVGGKSTEIARGRWTPVLPASAPLRLDFKSHYCQFVLRIELSALLRNLGILIGQPISRDLVFDQTEVRNPAMAALRRRVFDFANDFNARGAFFSDLAAGEVERMVIMKFLMCHRHSYTDLLLREPLPGGSSAVRKVEEFIAANWDKPLDIEGMATLARVSARSLFRQFKKDRGCSPAEFAKRIRLNRAREMLERCDEGTSVVQIALKCGFQNPGHFARDFRLVFGELPSETLKRGRPASRPPAVFGHGQ